ncbi:hypothetical protein [Treponema sp.]|uniref:hypothetical protein n=1 Tax=Treponema sp. TaxID=166 RepID=UPI00298D77DC|nr:hypothetical protein [Treponema sp.]MCR5612432.1 hypothetical protein [Treponema sp.]
MKKFLAVVAALFVAQSVFAQTKGSFANKKVTFTLPEGWEALEQGSPLLGYILLPVVEGDTFRENITVIEQELPKGTKMSEAQYIEAAIQGVAAMFKDFEVIEQGDNFITYKGIINDNKVVQRMKVTIKKNTVYLVTISYDQNDYETYKEETIKFVETIKFK